MDRIEMYRIMKCVNNIEAGQPFTKMDSDRTREHSGEQIRGGFETEARKGVFYTKLLMHRMMEAEGTVHGFKLDLDKC